MRHVIKHLRLTLEKAYLKLELIGPQFQGIEDKNIEVLRVDFQD